MNQIVCNNLKIGYDKNVLIDNLSFNVEKGDYLAILGANGSGKSTLIKTILGLNKPVGGSFYFINLTRKDIGYLSQQTPLQKDFPASVYEIVMTGFLGKSGIRPFYKKEQKDKANYYIKMLGLSNYKNDSFRTLSGGLQQRTLFARALCATEEILVLDEPTTSLDPLAAKDMYDIINHLNSHGITIIMVSHDVDHVLNYASKILYIDKTPFYGSTKEFVNYKNIERNEEHGA